LFFFSMLKEKIGVDEKDALLLSTIMHDPSTSQQALAKKLGLSQPSVNARVRKLKERGVLVETAGLDAKAAGLALVRVDCTCTDADSLLEKLRCCSFFVNAFILSGKRNLSLFLLGEDLGKVEDIVNIYLRSNSSVRDVELSVVVESAKSFLCSIDLSNEQHHPCADKRGCVHCSLRSQ
jgi:DNA-binding Lrp family transcriptional regulator